MLATQQKWTDLSLLSIGPSQIHGRGVFAAKNIAQGERLGLAWFDFYMTDAACRAENSSYLQPTKRGYISDGGTLKIETMTVEAGIEQCSKWDKCKGITFQDPIENSVCPTSPTTDDNADIGQCRANEVRVIEFKDKSQFGEDRNWQSFVKPGMRYVTFIPHTCMSNFYPEGGRDRAAISDENALSCWIRWVNHGCEPSVDIVFENMSEDFALPGMPWSRCVRSVTVFALRNIIQGEELTLNYEPFPSYMMRSVEGVAPCNSSSSSTSNEK